ncbi:MAG: hypothetical protein AAF960_23430 [Bacteroidota bacterium]
MSHVKTKYAADPYMILWTAEHLPNKKSFFISDLDLIIRDARNDKEHIMLIEIKRYMGKVAVCQQSTFDVLHKLINAGLHALKNQVRCKNGISHKIKYHGFHLLQFERSSFEDGKVYFDGKEVSEQQLINVLSFKRTKAKK